MPEIGRKRKGEVLKGVFGVLYDQPAGMRAADVLSAVEKRVPPTPFENDVYPANPSVRRYPKIVRFTTIASVKAGWLVKDKGSWSLTPEGRAAYETFTDPTALINESRRLYRVWKKQQAPEDLDDGGSADAVIESATSLEEAQDTASNAIREYVTTMPPYDFQHLVAALLGAMGYYGIG